MKKSGGSNMALRIGPVIENLEEISSFGIGKTNLRIDATWANTARHRGIGKQFNGWVVVSHLIKRHTPPVLIRRDTVFPRHRPREMRHVLTVLSIYL